MTSSVSQPLADVGALGCRLRTAGAAELARDETDQDWQGWHSPRRLIHRALRALIAAMRPAAHDNPAAQLSAGERVDLLWVCHWWQLRVRSCH
ncbi:MAG: hypothetical protein ACRDSR_23030, partial [Pseudonocardiaceae bacterium]